MIKKVKQILGQGNEYSNCEHTKSSSDWIEVYTKPSKRHEEKSLDRETNEIWTENDGVLMKMREVEIKYVCRRCGEETIVYTGQRIEGEENIIDKSKTTRKEAARKIIEDTNQKHISGGWNTDEVRYWSFSPFRGDNKTLSQIRNEILS